MPKKGNVFCDTLTYADWHGALVYPDCFITKFDKNGELIWNSYIGGRSDERATSCAVDPFDNVVVCGVYTIPFNYEQNFPTTEDAFQSYRIGGKDGIVFMFTPDGKRKWATYFVGSGKDEINDIVTDKDGSVFFCGYTESSDLPVSSGAFQTDFSAPGIFYLTRFDNKGMRKWVSYFGGSIGEVCYSIDVHGDKIIFAGLTSSSDFPIGNNPLFYKYEDRVENFIGIFNTLGHFIWSTIFRSQIPFGLEMASNDQLTYTGYTEAIQYPRTENAFQKENPSLEPPYPASSMLSSFKFSLLSVDEKNKMDEICLYPNPCNDFLWIKTPYSKKIEIIQVTNIMGTRINLSPNQANLNEAFIRINCPNGIYFVELVCDGQKLIKPFVVIN